MTQQEVVRALKAIRAYCQPEHLPAVEYAITMLRRTEEGKKGKL